MRKNNLQIIVNTDLVALCGSKPGSVAKAKLKNSRSVFSFGDNLKYTAKDSKRSTKITKKNPCGKDVRVVDKQYSEFIPRKSF